MLRPALPVLLVVALLAGSGCKREKAPERGSEAGAEAGLGGMGGGAGGMGGAAGGNAQQAVPMQAFAIAPNGNRIEIAPDGSTADVPVDARFELTSKLALTEVRIRLFDSADKLQPSKDKATVGQGFRYELAPDAGLEPGQYRIVVDDPRGGHPKDVSGIVYAPRDFRFTVGAPANGGGANGTGGAAGEGAAGNGG